ncbi:MAG: NADH-quinone oxidoreductase subunit NuoK [Actinomycetota bacterium]|nr:NADH-quinone oxidoreductase subunit NuoK [Actinomycetota bacterium]MDP8954467.1 NADH-quinone oxidoreductase subunit NuoK [Actinomycetota bacterium]
MELQLLLVVSAALFGIGVYGALSQQTFVMIMMGIELMLNGAMLAAVALWAMSGAGAPKGQLLTVIVMTVMAVEAALGFALVIGIFRTRQADMTEMLEQLKG